MDVSGWVAIIVAFVALVGVVVTAVLSRRSAKEITQRWRTDLAALEARTERAAEDTERRDKREQANEIYKWAAEMAISQDPRKAQTGVDALQALLAGMLLDDDMKLLVEAALESSYATPLRAIQQAMDADEAVVVYQVELEALEAPNIALEEDEEGRSEGHDDDKEADNA